MKRVNPLHAFGVGFLALALGGQAFANDVSITNQSDWELAHLYISSVDDEEWGPDQLGEDVIGSGETFTLRNIPCDTYDVKLIDEDGDECEVAAVDICGSGGWEIDNDDLLACQAETE